MSIGGGGAGRGMYIGGGVQGGGRFEVVYIAKP